MLPGGLIDKAHFQTWALPTWNSHENVFGNDFLELRQELDLFYTGVPLVSLCSRTWFFLSETHATHCALL